MEFQKKDTLAARLNQIMKERCLKQVDVLNLAKPYCEQYNVKLAKNYLSQYCNGKNEPGKEILNVLSLALDVNPAWLQGFDVPVTIGSNSADISGNTYTSSNNNKNNTKKEVKKMNKITKSTKLDNVL